MPLEAAAASLVPIPPSAAAPPPEKFLSITWVHQEQDHWCWAACCQMIFQHYAMPAQTQCALASTQFGPDCCASPGSTECNRGEWPENALLQNSLGCTRQDNQISPDDVRTEIAAGRPVEICFTWHDGGPDAAGTHVALITGYHANGDLEVADPKFGPGPRAYAFLQSAYGLGTWTQTYTDIAPA